MHIETFEHADLQGADLRDADLQDAVIYPGWVITKAEAGS